MRTPRHLWTGAWRDESEAARAAAGEEAARRQAALDAETEVAPAPVVRRRRPKPLAIAAAIVVLVGAAFTIGLLAHGSSHGTTARSSVALPAVDSSPLKPSHGQTRAAAIYSSA